MDLKKSTKHCAWKKWLFSGAGLLLLCALSLLYSEHRIRSRLHEGKTVGEWALQLLSPEAEARERAGMVLRRLGPKAVPELITLLQSRESRIRDKVWGRAYSIPWPLRRQVLHLVGVPRTTSTRVAATLALGLLGKDAGDATDELFTAVQDRNREVQFAALNALGRIGSPRATPFLIEALQNTNNGIRLISVTLLQNLETASPAVFRALVLLLDDPDEQVSVAAARALAGRTVSAGVMAEGAGVDLDEAVAKLLKMAGSKSKAVRRQAIETLGSLRADDPQVVSWMTEALRDGDPEIRLMAAKGLYRVHWNATPAVDGLIQALGDTSPGVRQWSVLALGKVGPEGKRAFPAIKRLFDDPEPGVRVVATNVVGRMEAAQD